MWILLSFLSKNPIQVGRLEVIVAGSRLLCASRDVALCKEMANSEMVARHET